jgi:hypothetical protein
VDGAALELVLVIDPQQVKDIVSAGEIWRAGLRRGCRVRSASPRAFAGIAAALAGVAAALAGVAAALAGVRFLQQFRPALP